MRDSSLPTILLSPEILSRCEDFAAAVVTTNLATYKRRNQGNQKKIIEQIITGKLGEFAFADWLGTEEPDLNIYEKKDKSFDADLFAGNVKIHVKSQTADSAEKYGISWMFQREDPLLINATDHDWLGLCVVDGTTVSLYSYVPVLHVIDLLREPILPQLRFTKRVLYWEDVKWDK